MSIKLKQIVKVTDGISAYGASIGDNLIEVSIRPALPGEEVMQALACMDIAPTQEQITAYSEAQEASAKAITEAIPGTRLVVVRSFNGQWLDGKAFSASVNAHKRAIRNRNACEPGDNDRLAMLCRLVPDKA